MCCRDKHDYQYWLRQQGQTVRITRGALAGTSGRLTGICHQYGMVFLGEKKTVDVVWGDLEVTP
jgi:hypothetical protein